MKHIALAILLTACSGYELPRHQTRISVTPEAAEAFTAAVALWSEAAEGEYAPTVTIDESCQDSADWCVSAVDEISGCFGQVGPVFGCTTHETRTILIQRDVAPELRESVFAHELGHSLGLSHTDSGLMNPHRPRAERENPCVGEGDVEAAGMQGPGACVYALR